MKKKGIDEDSVIYEVKKALDWQQDMYGLDDMVDDMDLTAAERAWAKENLYVTVRKYDEE